MKENLCTLVIGLFAIIFSSCDKEDTSLCNKEHSNDVKSEYYVKYSISSGASQYFINSFSVTTDIGKRIYNDRVKSWTQIYGPVEKGFEAQVDASGASTTSVEIYICKDNGSFALKATGGSSASYTIDF
ncbi:MAG: hypothetical protein ACRDDZ_03085 [Marinifilaceae bacterium]